MVCCKALDTRVKAGRYSQGRRRLTGRTSGLRQAPERVRPQLTIQLGLIAATRRQLLQAVAASCRKKLTKCRSGSAAELLQLAQNANKIGSGSPVPASLSSRKVQLHQPIQRRIIGSYILRNSLCPFGLLLVLLWVLGSQHHAEAGVTACPKSWQGSGQRHSQRAEAFVKAASAAFRCKFAPSQAWATKVIGVHAFNLA